MVDTALLQCSGLAERHAALTNHGGMCGGSGACRMSAADKGYDTKDFVKEMRGMNVTPHVSQNTKRQAGSH